MTGQVIRTSTYWGSFMNDQLNVGTDLEILFYSDTINLQIGWTSATVNLTNNGGEYEYWFKDDKLYTSDPS